MKHEGHNIIGKDLSEEDRLNISNIIDRARSESAMPLKREVKKPESLLKFLEFLNNYFYQLAKRLKARDVPVIRPDQIHLLDKEMFEEMDWGKDVRAFSENGSIYINIDQMENESLLFATLAHEAFHEVSLMKYKGVKYENVYEYRSGYEVSHPRDKDYHPFQGLNEAVTEQSVVEFVTQNSDMLQEEFKMDSLSNIQFAYPTGRRILQLLISRVAETNNETREEVWSRLQRGVFTGEMMHLRDIEKSFGKNTLKLISIWGNFYRGLRAPEVNTKILKFLSTEDLTKKEQIIREIESLDIHR